MNKASCLCGIVKFNVTEFEPIIGHCHCTMCRKFHGAAFSTFGEVKRENIMIEGEEHLSHYQADNGSVRSFCKSCGASLLFESRFNREANTLEVALAIFDEIEQVQPDAHIYLESKVEWFSPQDDLLKFKRYRE